MIRNAIFSRWLKCSAANERIDEKGLHSAVHCITIRYARNTSVNYNNNNKILNNASADGYNIQQRFSEWLKCSATLK